MGLTSLPALVLVAALLGSGCTKARTCKLEPYPAGTQEPAFLWRVQKAGGGDVVWLYGTIHDAGMDAVPRVAIEALEKSVRVVSELGATKPDPDVFRKYARVQSGLGIDQGLLAGDWYDLRDALRGVIKEEHLRRAAPWYAMSLLTTHMAPKPGPSMDSLIGKRAQELAMPVDALETWEQQLAMLNSAVDVSDLQEAIRARETMKCDLARMRAAYLAGDTPRMTAYLVVPRTAEPLLYKRNREWLPKIEAYLPTGGAFVAVGLGHLLGEHGLPTLLAKRGYTVERVTTR